MAVSRDDVLNYLGREEPPYLAAASLGPACLPILAEMARGNEPELAAKATSLAAHIRGGAAVIDTGLDHVNPAVRISAAAAIRFVDEAAQRLLEKALADSSPQVRKWALRSADKHPLTGLRTALERVARSDPDDRLRERASDMLRRPR